MVEEKDDAYGQTYRVGHLQGVQPLGLPVHHHPIDFREHVINAYVIVVCHNGKGRAEEAHQTHQHTLHPLLPALMPVHIDPFHQHIRLPHDLYADTRAGLLHQLYQMEGTDHAAPGLPAAEMVHFQGFQLGGNNGIHAAQRGHIR